MTDATRALVAYLAGRLVCGGAASAVYDAGRSRTVEIRGRVDATEISVRDHDQQCLIAGRAAGSRFSLFHHGAGSHLEIEIEGARFRGYDHSSAAFFEGRVEGTGVLVFDAEDGRHSEYYLQT